MNKFQNLHFLSNTKPEPKKPTTLNIPISKGVTSSIVMICPSLSMTTSSNILTSRQTPLYSFHKPAPYLTMLEIGLDAHDPGIVFRLSLHCSHIFLLRFIDKQYFVSSLPPNAQYHLRKSPQSGSKTTLPYRSFSNQFPACFRICDHHQTPNKFAAPIAKESSGHLRSTVKTGFWGF